MKIIIEGATLVDKIETIENSIFLREEDKKSLLRQLLCKYIENHPLFDKATSGDISISDTAEELLRPYQGWRIALPIIRGRGHNKKLEKYNLHELIGGYMLKPASQSSYRDRALYWVIDKCVNPVGVALFAAGSIVGARALFGGGQRELEGVIGNAALFGYLLFHVINIGLMWGSYEKYQYVKGIRKKARSLHERVHARYSGCT